MGRVLNAATVVRDPRTTAVVTLPAGTSVPDWAEDLIGEHLTTGGETAVEGEGTPTSTLLTSPASAEERVESPALTEPPRAGRGSGLDAWKAYAAGLGITVPDDLTRDDIIALVTDN